MLGAYTSLITPALGTFSFLHFLPFLLRFAGFSARKVWRCRLFPSAHESQLSFVRSLARRWPCQGRQGQRTKLHSRCRASTTFGPHVPVYILYTSTCARAVMTIANCKCPRAVCSLLLETDRNFLAYLCVPCAAPLLVKLSALERNLFLLRFETSIVPICHICIHCILYFFYPRFRTFVIIAFLK